MTISALRDIVSPLRDCFLATGYDTETLPRILGASAHAALGRGEPVPVRRALRDAGRLGLLCRLLLLGDALTVAEATAALAPLSPTDAAAAGLVRIVGGSVRVAVDVRPVDAGHGARWFFSDPDGSLYPHRAAEDHVLGVGQASLSLLRATPTRRTGSVLDVGTGCGIQAVHAAERADSVTATDISARCIDMAAASLAINGVDAELLRGSWYEPIRGRRFDTIVANPPFVVGTGRIDHEYRDSGLDLDGASELMVSGAVEHLAPGGVATILASWVHLAGEPDWVSRPASWLPGHGVDAWIVQRDVADPALYVSTWMKDGGLDPSDPSTAGVADRWLGHLDRRGVTGIGFGVVTLRRTDEDSDILIEELAHPYDDPLGPEASAHLDRVDWLRARTADDIDGTRFALAPRTALERVFLPDDDAGMGWREVVVRVHRGDGPRWAHEIDPLGASLLAGLHPEGLPLGEISAMLAVAHDLPIADVAADARALVVDLVRHGLVIPADLLPADHAPAAEGGPMR